MRSLFSISFFILAWALFSQTPTRELEMEIESIAEGNEENETDLQQLGEYLQQLEQDPILINFATVEDLQRLPYLNIFQASNLIQYRQNTGPLYSPYELMAIKGFDQATIRKILPYLSFETELRIPVIKPEYVWKYSRHDVIARMAQVLEKRKGFTDDSENPYLGKPQNYYLRYRGTYRNLLSVGVVAQQDPGEPFGGKYQKSLVDHLSGHLALQNYGPLKTLIIGDYQAEFGQGLALWTGLAFGKSAEAAEIKRYARGFRPFTGSEENRYMRGAAATYRLWDKLDVSAFYSNNSLDANLQTSDSSTVADFVSSLQTTGLHRTAGELADKNVNHLQSFGGNINFRGNGFSVGATVVNYQLEIPLEWSGRLYQKFNFTGKDLMNFSVDANYLYQDINLFGELAADDEGHLTGTLGLQSNPADGLYLSLLHRHFDKKYQALFNAPFSESGSYGESGTYLGMMWDLSPLFTLKSYVDVYSFDWLRFRVDAPSEGYELQAQLEMYFSRYFTAYIRGKRETNQINSAEETSIQQLSERTRSNLRLHLDYSLSKELKAASRIEYAFYQQENRHEQGMMFFQDLSYSLPGRGLKLTTRFALIDTESYDTRIYAYERDVTYAFSIPPYFGKAFRSYFLAGYDLTENLQFQARYSLTSFSDRELISSGQQEIEGNTISELKLQLRWKF